MGSNTPATPTRRGSLPPRFSACSWTSASLPTMGALAWPRQSGPALMETSDQTVSTNPPPAIAGGAPVRAELLPYGRQTVDDADINAVVDVLRSAWLTT